MWSDKSTIFTCFLLPSPWTHSVCTLCDVCFCFCAISWSMWLLHRLRGDPLVPGPRAAGGRHSVRTSGGRLGDRLRVRWAAVGDPSVAREVWHGPTLSDQEDSRWERPAAEGKHRHIFSWKTKKNELDLLNSVLRSSFSSSAGDLIPRHQQVFSNNQFFCGVSVPEPQEMVRHTAHSVYMHHHYITSNQKLTETSFFPVCRNLWSRNIQICRIKLWVSWR